MAAQGCTNKEIAETLGIVEETLYNYLRNRPDFSEALKHSKSIANKMVQAAAFRRAIGYKKKSIKIALHQESGRFLTHEYIEHLPPDPTMMQYWLNNRERDDWQPPKAGNQVSGDSPIMMKYDPSKRLTGSKAQPPIVVDVTPIKNSGALQHGDGEEKD